MSYRCGICDEQQPPRTTQHMVVLETKKVVHPRRPKVYRTKDDSRSKWKDDPGGEGTQIVREVGACAICAGVEIKSDDVAEVQVGG